MKRVNHFNLSILKKFPLETPRSGLDFWPRDQKGFHNLLDGVIRFVL